MILLFTAVRGRPYKRDLLNVCCDRKGARLRFSYKRKWVPESITRTPDKLKGQIGLVVFCENLDVPLEKPMDVESLQLGRAVAYHPVRRVKIVDVQLDESALNLDLEFDRFFDIAGRSSETTFSSSFLKFIEQSTERPVLEDMAHAKWIRVEPDDKYIGEHWFTDNWSQLAAHLAQLRGLNNCIFLRVHALTGTGSEPAPLLPDARCQDNWTLCTAKRGVSYKIGVQVLRGTLAPVGEPEIDISGQLAHVHGPVTIQHSGGVQARFIIHFRQGFESEESFAVVRQKRQSDGSPCSPEILTVVTVKPSRLLFGGVVTLLLVGSLLTSVGPDLLRLIHKDFFEPHIAAWVTASKLLGAIFFGVGSFLGFNKLPLKSG